MCANFQPSSQNDIRSHLGLEILGQYDGETWPGGMAPLIRRITGTNKLEARVGHFGLLPSFAKDIGYCRRTYNARSETVSQLPSFRQAWAKGHFCLIPVSRFYEPRYEDGKAVRWAVTSDDGAPLCIAGLWSRWVDPQTAKPAASFTMLTLNADTHPLMNRFHKPEEEKRMVYVVKPDEYAAWLNATPDTAYAMIEAYAAERMLAEPAPLPPRQSSVAAKK